MVVADIVAELLALDLKGKPMAVVRDFARVPSSLMGNKVLSIVLVGDVLRPTRDGMSTDRMMGCS